MKDILNTVKYVQALAPQVIQGSALTSGNIDTQGHDSLAIVVCIGEIVDTLGSSDRIDLKIEHADDDGSGAPGAYSACADEDVLGFTGLSSGLFKSVDADAEENARYVIGYRGGKRFVKVTATPVSLSTGGPIAMIAVKGHIHQGPADNA